MDHVAGGSFWAETYPAFLSLDGLGGQEDELEDVERGEVDRSTKNESGGPATEDEEDDAVKQARLNP